MLNFCSDYANEVFGAEFGVRFLSTKVEKKL
jgi:hypothetical protein